MMSERARRSRHPSEPSNGARQLGNLILAAMASDVSGLKSSHWKLRKGGRARVTRLSGR